jgi:hypothetical protein
MTESAVSVLSAAPAASVKPVASAVQWLCKRGETDVILGLAKERQRLLVLDKVDAMLRIETGIVSGLSRQRAIEAAAKLFMGKRGFSVSNLIKDFILWTEGGQKPDSQGRRGGKVFSARDWRVFVPGYNNGHPDAALSNAAFVRYVRQLHADTCREDATGNALQARLLDEWFAGRSLRFLTHTFHMPCFQLPCRPLIGLDFRQMIADAR